MSKFLLSTACWLIFQYSYSQCNITVVGAPCVGTNIQFFCNSTNGVEHYWKFDAKDSFKLNCNTQWIFPDTGRKRIALRVKDAQGNTCLDTAYLTLRYVSTQASIKQSRPICNTIIDLTDSSYIIQPLDSDQDSIVKWTYRWDFNKNVLLYSKPLQYTTVLKGNGYHNLFLKTETKYGCQDSSFKTIYIPGPIVSFDTFIPRYYCKNEEIGFNNMSWYGRQDSCIWLWDWGDNSFSNQYDTFYNYDTVRHHYESLGSYHVRLYLNYTLIGNNGLSKKCSQVFPDTTGLGDNHIKLRIRECSNSALTEASLNKALTIFPNPANGEFHILGFDNTEIFMINSVGLKVHHFYNRANQTIETVNLPQGLYLLTDGHSKILGKLIIAR